MDIYGRWKGIILIFSSSFFAYVQLNLKKINHQVDLCWLCAVCARCFYHHAMKHWRKGDRARKNPNLVVRSSKKIYRNRDTKRIGTCSLFFSLSYLPTYIYIWFISSLRKDWFTRNGDEDNVEDDVSGYEDVLLRRWQ